MTSGPPPASPGRARSEDRSEARPSFVGRRSELRSLGGVLAPGQVRGGLVLVTGEPGIGKSTLAEQFALEARERGAEVHWGRCWEAGGAPPYWPWISLIRSRLRTSSAGWAQSLLGARAAPLAHLVPELTEGLDEAGEAGSSDPELERFRLFEAVAVLLRAASAEQPLILILDDLHAADTPSLLLLQFLVGELVDVPVGFLALYRSTELTPGHPVIAAEAALLRVPGAQRIELSGLETGEVGQLIEMTAGRAVPLPVVTAVHERTDGNPLFVGEVARLILAAEGPAAADAVTRAAIPGGIRDAIGGRLGGLPEPTRDLLSVAAVLGREFALEVLARMTDVHVLTLLEDLQHVITEGLVAPAPGRVGHVRFSHDLVRECLYEELGAARRLQLHLRAGEVLDEFYGPERDEHLAEIAHHYFAAAPEGDIDRAIRYARLAGAAALRALAYEEAARLFRMALALTEGRLPRDEADHCELLLAVGDADARAGDMASAQESFLAAADIARRGGLPEALARAALGYGGRFPWIRAGQDRVVVRLLEDALDALGPDDSVYRVQVLARLACALRDQVDPVRRDRLSEESVAMARRIGEPRALAYALNGRYGALWSPDRAEERLAVAADLVEMASMVGDKEDEIAGFLAHIVALWEVGDVEAMRMHLDRVEALAGEIRQPAQRWVTTLLRAALALFEGRFAEGEALAGEAYEAGRSSIEVDSETARVLQMYVLERERGRAASVEPALRHAARTFTGYFHFPSVIAHLEAERGNFDEARAILRRTLGGAEPLRAADNYWHLMLTLLAEVAFVLGDEDDAVRLAYEQLEPYGDHQVLGPPEVSLGVVHRPLGILAALLGRWDDAVTHFEAAVVANDAAGAAPWVAWTRYQYAAALSRRGAEGDSDRAAALLGAARETAQALGMTLLERRIEELAPGGALLSTSAVTSVVGAGGEPANVFRRDGDVWTVAFGGASFQLRHTKGLQYLGALLAVPGREIPAVDLVASGDGGRAPSSRGREPGLERRSRAPDEPVLDRQARAAYERRLLELEDELREAEEWADTERASRAREEMDFLAQELAHATGLGGRARQMTTDAERARQSVRKAISSALARIGEHSRPLREHLERTVSTGYVCRYAPDPRVPADWAL